MTNQLTSRIPLGDILELLGDLIADASHLQELIHSEGIDLDKKDRYKKILLEKVDMRRAIMNELGVVDKELRCNIKHNIGIWQFSQEVYYNLRTPFWEEIYEKGAEHLFTLLSEALGRPITKCGRCLNDALMDNDLDTNDNDGVIQDEMTKK